MAFEARETGGLAAFIRGFEAFTGGSVATFLLWLTRPAQNVGDIIEAGETDSDPFIVIKTGDYPPLGGDLVWGIGGDEETIYFAHNDLSFLFPAPLINNLSPSTFAVLREVPGPESKLGGGIGGNAATVWYSLFTIVPKRQTAYELDPSDLSVVGSAEFAVGPGDIGGDSTVLYTSAIESTRWILDKRLPGFFILVERIDTTISPRGFAVGGDADRAFFYRSDIVNDSIVEFDTTTLANIRFLQSGSNIISLGGQT